MTREEAIRILASSCIPGSKQTEALETLIPELAESEDERIRKEIVSALKFANDGGVYDKHIAYLEKQKAKEKQDRMMPVYNDRDSFESALDKAWKSYNESGARTVDGCEDDYVECAHAKGFREGYLFGIEKQKEQKPEWSEDDERKRDGIIQWLHEYQKEFNPKYDSLSIESIESLIDWLKSLRPSWKPSEEQMKALHRSIYYLHGEGYEYSDIQSLYEELRKLGVKEEPEYYQHFDPDC